MRDGWIRFGLSTVCYHLDPPLDHLLHCPPPHRSRRLGFGEVAHATWQSLWLYYIAYSTLNLVLYALLTGYLNGDFGTLYLFGHGHWGVAPHKRFRLLGHSTLWRSISGTNAWKLVFVPCVLSIQYLSALSRGNLEKIFGIVSRWYQRTYADAAGPAMP